MSKTEENATLSASERNLYWWAEPELLRHVSNVLLSRTMTPVAAMFTTTPPKREVR